MSYSFDSYLGIHQPALEMYSQRAQVLAGNLANSDTPGYKARDIDFKSTLKSIQEGRQPSMPLQSTNAKHIQPPELASGYELMYRQPHQASLDGNTVEEQVELAAYTENSMRYLMGLKILSSKFNGLRLAIKGQ